MKNNLISDIKTAVGVFRIKQRRIQEQGREDRA